MNLPLIRSPVPYNPYFKDRKCLRTEKPSRKEFNEMARKYFEQMIKNYAGKIALQNFGYLNYRENHTEIANNLRLILEYALRTCNRKQDTLHNVELYFAASVKNYRMGLRSWANRERHYFINFDHVPGEEGESEEKFEDDENGYVGSNESQNKIEYDLLTNDIKTKLRDDFDKRVFELLIAPPAGLKDIRKQGAYRHKESYSYKTMFKILKKEFPICNLYWHNHGEYQLRPRKIMMKDIAYAIGRIKKIVREIMGLKKVKNGRGYTSEKAIEMWKVRKKKYGYSGRRNK